METLIVWHWGKSFAALNTITSKLEEVDGKATVATDNSNGM